jgi:uncharacterized membrane protein
VRSIRRKPRISWEVVIFSTAIALFSFVQMRNYVLTFWPIGHSDLVGFYVTRFPNGGHYWPYDSYSIPGKNGQVPPIEYPVLTGIVVWLTSLVTPVGPNGRFSYFYINVALIGSLFVYSSHLIYQFLGKKYARYFLASPVLVFSLYLNWDLWVVVPLILAITLFEKHSYLVSALWLGIAIAAKFFPIVLFLPIIIYFSRQKAWKLMFKYLAVSVGAWLVINIPVMIKSPEGWLYFYKFSATRILGDGSFYNLFAKFGLNFEFPMAIYYLLNILVFGLFIFWLLKSQRAISLAESSFFAIAAFTFFGKQYSMQYILWLLPPAIFALSKVPKLKQKNLLKLFVLWQLGELFLNYAYFKNYLREINDMQYAFFGTFRYLAFGIFIFMLAKALLETQSKKVKNP